MSTVVATSVRILVVDDDLDMQFLIRSILSADPRLECIAEAASTSEAIALTLEVGPALVILDHQIEGEVMGLQAAQLIKSVAPNTRIILFTSQDLSFEASREPAIDLYLPKSDLQRLLAAAQQVMGLTPLA